ncbi:MAG: ABC transporter ATP-binding protein [Chromatocurvus sp.]
METVVECQALSKTYSGAIEAPALVDVDLAIARGEFVCFAGPSGSGKTTLLNLIGGLDTPSTGCVTVTGERLDRLDRAALAALRLNRIGFVFQAYNLIPVLTAQENVEFVLQFRGVSPAQCHALAREALAEVGLDGLEQRRPGELSGGQQQRVAVARAIAGKPELLLADEPTANLDSATGQRLIELLGVLNGRHGITCVISTHDPQVLRHARRVVRMHDGRLVDDSDSTAS